MAKPDELTQTLGKDGSEEFVRYDAPPEEDRLAKILRQMDDDVFQERQRATDELRAYLKESPTNMRHFADVWANTEKQQSLEVIRRVHDLMPSVYEDACRKHGYNQSVVDSKGLKDIAEIMAMTPEKAKERVEQLRAVQAMLKATGEGSEQGKENLESYIRVLKNLDESKKQLSKGFCVDKLADEDVKQLAAFPELKHLALRNPQLSQEGWKQLGRLNIPSLYLDGRSVTDATIKDMADSLPKLERLVLDGVSLGADGWEGLSAIRGLKSLTIQGADREVLQHINLRGLETLSLKNASATAEQIKAMKGFSALKHLRVSSSTFMSEEEMRKANSGLDFQFDQIFLPD